MLKDFISNQIFSNFNHTPTPSQKEAVSVLSTFITDSSPDSLCLLQGFAGTGKTTLIASLVKTMNHLKIKTILLAPTGRAAKVLANYSKQSAFTIHKSIYRQKSLSSGSDAFALDFNPYSNTIFIVDEASMIPDVSGKSSIFGTGRLLLDLMTYVYNNKQCKLLIVGDTAQLPPVGLEESPALSNTYLQKEFFKTVYFSRLTDVVRQSTESAILKNATQLRNNLSNNNICIPKFYANPKTDVESVSGMDVIDLISRSYDTHGIKDTIIVTRSNKLANIYNKGIRHQILWQEEEISVGDYIMVVKNNYFWTESIPEINFIANGDIAEIISIKKYHELYNKRFASIAIRLIDYDIELDVIVMLDTLSLESPSLTSEESKAFFYTVAEDFEDISSKKKKYEAIRNNKYFNALQIKFAYAVTCHKAQGGQWKHVYVDHGYMPEINPTKDMYRWFYTAITRAKEKLYLINFNKDFFE